MTGSKGFRPWLQACIHRIQGLEVSYDRSQTIKLTSRDSDTVKAALVQRTGLVWDLFSDDRRCLDAWVALLNGERFMLREFEDTLKMVKEDYFSDAIQGLLTPDFFKGSLIRRKRVFPLWAACAPLAYASYSDEIDVARRMNQWCSFASRLSLFDLDLRESCLNEYIEDEDRLGSFSIDMTLADRMEQVFYSWMTGFSVNWALCAHGTGACAEVPRGTPAFLKNYFLGTNPRIRYLLLHEPQLVDCYADTDYSVISHNVVQAVPKNIRVNRLVSKEPAALQYLQHGIERSLKLYLERNPALDAYFHPADQCVNRRAALVGSVGGNIATLDLSKASDTVTIELVTALCRRLPALRRALILTRSTHAELEYPDRTKKIVRLHKFAPMGSDTCFDIERLVFGALVEVSYQQEYGKPSKPGTWSVYGDDIVVPSRIAYRVIANLRRMGFLPNVAKSYFHGGERVFRESCGAECFGGYDITPVRISRFFGYCSESRSREYPRCVEQLCDLCNICYSRHLTGVRIACLYLLRGVLYQFGGPAKLPYYRCEPGPEYSYDLSYYFSDGRKKYQWMYPIRASVIAEEVYVGSNPSVAARNATNYATLVKRRVTGPHGMYLYSQPTDVCDYKCIQTILRSTKAVQAVCRKYHITTEEQERLMLIQWFNEARLREYGRRQLNSIDNVDNWRDSDAAYTGRPIAIQREGKTQRIVLSLRSTILTDTSTVRTWVFG